MTTLLKWVTGRPVAAALIAVLAVLQPNPRVEPEREPYMRQVYSGAAFLYSVLSVTVVYPGGPGEDRERNRISAERRAAYLTGRHETETHVVADVDVTAEHLGDNLLILGWNNKLLLDTGNLTLTEEGWNFQGIERGFQHDLLFGWVSPFDSSRQFAFWSRIDPELDRYLPLPFFGSDWVVFDRYYVEQYGRFGKKKVAWPPVPDPSLTVDNRPMRSNPSATRSSEHYELHDLTFGLTPQEVARILEAREKAWDRTVNILGTPRGGGKKIKLYVYADSEQKEKLSFVHDARHHMPRERELHLTKVIALDEEPHEDSHLIARELFGPGYLTLLVEGLAVRVEQDGKNEIPVYANMLVQRGDVPPVEHLLDEERMRRMMRNSVGFPYAGLFVSWLHDEFGLQALARTYGLYSSDPSTLAEAIGIPVTEIDAKFLDYVRAQAKAGETEAAFRAARGEGRHFAQLGDYERAVPALQRALEVRPEHLPTYYALAVLQIDLGQAEDAEKALKLILDADDEVRGHALTVLSWFQLGELYSKAGEAQKARQAYQKVFELPDHRETHATARERLAELDGSAEE